MTGPTGIVKGCMPLIYIGLLNYFKIELCKYCTISVKSLVNENDSHLDSPYLNTYFDHR
jgi:hypothetical protein